MNHQKSDQEIYDELALYTLQLRDKAFIHQYIVDAYAAQHANLDTKPITVAFALAGLYLHLEKGYSGREVQLAHMKMAKEKKSWPKFDIPVKRGDITVSDVLEALPGLERNEMINKWSESAWRAWSSEREKVIQLMLQTPH